MTLSGVILGSAEVEEDAQKFSFRLGMQKT